MITRLTQHLRPVKPMMVFGAWFFIVVSLAHVLFATAAMWGHPTQTFKLYHTIVNDASHDPWGLVYPGIGGLIMVTIQTLAVSAAVFATVWPKASSRARRRGHLVLMAWSALWVVDFIWMASIDHQLTTIAQATLLSFLFFCTTGRAILSWSSGRSTKLPPPFVPDPEPAPQRDPGFDENLRATLGLPEPPEPPAPKSRVSVIGNRFKGMGSHAKRVLVDLRKAIAAVLCWLGRGCGRVSGWVTPSAPQTGPAPHSKA